VRTQSLRIDHDEDNCRLSYYQQVERRMINSSKSLSSCRSVFSLIFRISYFNSLKTESASLCKSLTWNSAVAASFFLWNNMHDFHHSFLINEFSIVVTTTEICLSAWSIMLIRWEETFAHLVHCGFNDSDCDRTCRFRPWVYLKICVNSEIQFHHALFRNLVNMKFSCLVLIDCHHLLCHHCH
jgi:hypothetical protein